MLGFCRREAKPEADEAIHSQGEETQGKLDHFVNKVNTLSGEGDKLLLVSVYKTNILCEGNVDSLFQN